MRCAVFRGEPREWLGSTRHIAIELHGPAERAAFEEALAPSQWRHFESHQLTIATNLQLNTA